MKKVNVAKGELIVTGLNDDGSVNEVYIGEVTTEFFDNYYSLSIKFPDASFKKYWISQKTRIPKMGKAR